MEDGFSDANISFFSSSREVDIYKYEILSYLTTEKCIDSPKNYSRVVDEELKLISENSQDRTS